MNWRLLSTTTTNNNITEEVFMRETTCGASRKDTWYGDHDGENKFLHTVTIPHVQDLKDANLCHSLTHQQKFFTTRETVISWVKTHEEQRHLLYASGHKHFALILNENYAFRHIFKNGGTTISAQTGQTAQTGPEIQHVRQSDIGNRSLLATVRDPIDHFLSGWAECGKKHFTAMKKLIDPDATYDDRVRAWLHYVRYGSNKCALRKGLLSCRAHSHPQANFLFLNETTFGWDPRYDIIGNLREMPGSLNMIGFPYTMHRFQNVMRQMRVKPTLSTFHVTKVSCLKKPYRIFAGMLRWITTYLTSIHLCHVKKK